MKKQTNRQRQVELKGGELQAGRGRDVFWEALMHLWCQETVRSTGKTRCAGTFKAQKNIPEKTDPAPTVSGYQTGSWPDLAQKTVFV